MINYDNTDYKLSAKPINDSIKKTLVKHYARLLAQAYSRSTGQTLANPEAHIKPRFNLVMGHAANVDPKIYRKLNMEGQMHLGGWSSHVDNPDPLLLADAADYLNYAGGFRSITNDPETGKEYPRQRVKDVRVSFKEP